MVVVVVVVEVVVIVVVVAVVVVIVVVVVVAPALAPSCAYVVFSYVWDEISYIYIPLLNSLRKRTHDIHVTCVTCTYHI